jgi:hypothetical protein
MGNTLRNIIPVFGLMPKLANWIFHQAFIVDMRGYRLQNKKWSNRDSAERKIVAHIAFKAKNKIESTMHEETEGKNHFKHRKFIH